VTESLILNIVEGLSALLVGGGIPLAFLYVIRSMQQIKLSGWRRLLALIKKIALTLLVFVFFGGVIMGLSRWAQSVLGVEPERLMLSPGWIIGSNVGFWGGIWLLVIGYRRGRRAAKAELRPNS